MRIGTLPRGISLWQSRNTLALWWSRHREYQYNMGVLSLHTPCARLSYLYVAASPRRLLLSSVPQSWACGRWATWWCRPATRREPQTLVPHSTWDQGHTRSQIFGLLDQRLLRSISSTWRWSSRTRQTVNTVLVVNTQEPRQRAASKTNKIINNRN